MDEEIQDVATDTNVEVEEDTNINEPVEETVDAEKEELRRAKAQLTARAKKAEEELKTLKAKPQENNNNDPHFKDELRLVSQGLSEEEIEQARVIAKGKGVSLPEATKDPLFTIFQADLKEKQRKEEAKLGASKGSGETQEEATGLKYGSTREEHEKAWKKRVGKK